jgi:transcriptional regulator with XRE-family HTH domain
MLRAKFDLMTKFGDLVRLAREEKGWSQRQLARRIGKSPSYVHYVERQYNPSAKDQKMRVGEDAVEKLAKTLELDIDEARHAAGYSSRFSAKPENLQELLDKLERLGVPPMIFSGLEQYENASPEVLQEVLESIRFGVEYTLRKHGIE